MLTTNGARAARARACYDKICLSAVCKRAKRPAMRLRRFASGMMSILFATGVAAPAAAQVEQGDNLDHQTVTETWRDNLREWSFVVARKAQNAYARDLVPMGIEGRVVVQFRIETDGAVSDCETVRTSGSTELDALVCIAIEKTGPAPVYVNANGVAEPQTAQLPVRFVLSDIWYRAE